MRFSGGFLRSGKHIGSDKISIIKDNYPDLNMNWLLFDEGNMIIGNEKQSVSEPTAQYNRETGLDAQFEEMFVKYLESPRSKKVVKRIVSEHMINVNSMLQLLVTKGKITKELEAELIKNLKKEA